MKKYFDKNTIICSVIILLGLLFYTFSSGKWNVPLFAFIWPLTFVLFERFNKKKILLIGALILLFFLSGIKWYPILDTPSFLNILIGGAWGLIQLVPFVVDHFAYKLVRGFKASLILPLTFVTFDFLLLLTPCSNFGNLASTQRNLVFIQSASLFGSVFITFIIAWFASIVAYLVEIFINRKVNKVKTKQIIVPTTIYCCLITFVMCFGAIRLSTSNNQDNIRIAMVARENNNNIEQSLNDIKQDIETASLGNADLLVFSEEIAEVKPNDESYFLDNVKQYAYDNNIFVLVTLDIHGENKPYYNKAYLLDNQNNILINYTKNHPVPIDEDGYVAGDGKITNITVTFPSGKTAKLANVICMDGDFSAFIRDGLDNDSGILLTPTWDWAAIRNYHTWNAIYRSIENGCSMIRSTTDGVSSISDSYGRITTYSDTKDVGYGHVVFGDATINPKFTLYKYVGPVTDWCFVIGLAVLLGTFIPLNLYNDKHKNQ